MVSSEFLDSSHRSIAPDFFPRMASVSGRRAVSVEEGLVSEHAASLGAVGRECIKVACRVRPAARDEPRVWLVFEKVRISNIVLESDQASLDKQSDCCALLSIFTNQAVEIPQAC